MLKFTSDKIKQNHYLLGLIVLIVVYYIYGFVGKYIHMDEAIIGEHAYWFSKLGYVKSQLFVGMGQGWESRQFFYHKLFVWVGATFIKIFGFNILVLRAITLLSFLVFILIFWIYIKKHIIPIQYIWLLFLC